MYCAVRSNARLTVTFVAALIALPAAAHMRVDYPLGGEVFEGGDTVEVRWDAYIYHGPGSALVEFSQDGGQSFSTLVNDYPIPSENETAGTYEWQVPFVESTECRIRATYTVDGGDLPYIDQSGNFTVTSASKLPIDSPWALAALSAAAILGVGVWVRRQAQRGPRPACQRLSEEPQPVKDPHGE
jgi:hypothetical protein